MTEVAQPLRRDEQSREIARLDVDGRGLVVVAALPECLRSSHRRFRTQGGMGLLERSVRLDRDGRSLGDLPPDAGQVGEGLGDDQTVAGRRRWKRGFSGWSAGRSTSAEANSDRAALRSRSAPPTGVAVGNAEGRLDGVLAPTGGVARSGLPPFERTDRVVLQPDVRASWKITSVSVEPWTSAKRFGSIASIRSRRRSWKSARNPLWTNSQRRDGTGGSWSAAPASRSRRARGRGRAATRRAPRARAGSRRSKPARCCGTPPGPAGIVPAEAEAVAVGRLGSHASVQALVDDAVLGVEQQLFDEHRLPAPRHPATHVLLSSRSAARAWCCLVGARRPR